MKFITFTQLVLLIFILSSCIDNHKPSRYRPGKIDQFKIVKSQSTPKINLDSISVINIDSTLKCTPFVRIPDLPENFDTVPGGNWVFRSSQPTADQLKRIIETYNIACVIRLNGPSQNIITPQQELQLVTEMGRGYWYIDEDLGYQRGKGYVTSLASVQPYLHYGHVLIHCENGSDKTGYQIGRYISDKLGWSEKQVWNYSIKYNNWEVSIEKKEDPYIKYLEAFYPYELWKKEIGN